jgi:hypothetical protein
MLLKSEVKLGEVYVYDPEFNFGDETPSLYQLVEEPYTTTGTNMNGDSEPMEVNGTYENLQTGELVSYGTHVFTTIERFKKMFFNLKHVKARKQEYVKQAMELIQKYETEKCEVIP